MKKQQQQQQKKNTKKTPKNKTKQQQQQKNRIKCITLRFDYISFDIIDFTNSHKYLMKKYDIFP